MLLALLIYVGTAGAAPDPFARVLAFGASVTHGTPARIPAYAWGIRRIEDWASWRGRYTRPAGAPAKPRRYGVSPVAELVTHFRGARAAKHITYLSRWRTYSQKDLGSAQCQAMLEGTHARTLARATMIVGIDAFYWDAIWNTCGADLDRRILDFMARARTRGQVLMLGTVPIEDPARVRIDSARIGVPLWWPPDPGCAARINDLLTRECRVEDGCYMIDLKGAVDRLNAGEMLSLRDGRRFGIFGMRPDGIHLSDVGARYGGEMMVDALERHPPAGLIRR